MKTFDLACSLVTEHFLFMELMRIIVKSIQEREADQEVQARKVND